MADIDRENQASSPCSITGGDEQYKADVVQDLDGNKKLFVKATVTDGDVTVSNSLRILESQSSQNINVGSFTTIYTLSVPAVCSGFMLKANTSNFTVKLEVDGDTLFEIDTNWLQTFVNWNNSGNPPVWISFNSSANVFYFVPALPLKITSNITISAKSNQGNRRIDGYYIQVAEI